MARNWRIWRPVAWALSVVNIGGAGFHIALEQPQVAFLHLLLAGGAAFWAVRGGRKREAEPLAPGTEERMEQLEAELMHQRQELLEAQERLDFAERLLAQSAERKRELQ
jgi:hypothetical protein